MPDQPVTVYTSPACQGCKATKRYLDNRNVEYATIDVSEDAAALDFIKGLGYVQAPVVVAGDEHWSGFQPTRLDALA